MANQTIKNTADLRKMLIDVIDSVRAGTIEPKAAREIVRISSAILDSARLDLEVLKYNASGEKLDAAGKNVLQLVAS